MKPEQSESNLATHRRKTGDRALILLLIGCLLLTPPLANIFQLDWRIFGIPFTGIYLFAVWAGLIAGTAYLARRLQIGADWDNQQHESEPDDSEAAD
jgi:hypothetical protein